MIPALHTANAGVACDVHGDAPRVGHHQVVAESADGAALAQQHPTVPLKALVRGSGRNGANREEEGRVLGLERLDLLRVRLAAALLELTPHQRADRLALLALSTARRTRTTSALLYDNKAHHLRVPCRRCAWRDAGSRGTAAQTRTASSHTLQSRVHAEEHDGEGRGAARTCTEERVTLVVGADIFPPLARVDNQKMVRNQGSHHRGYSVPQWPSI